MSVSKIIKELNCNIIFSSNNVIFQDIVTKRTIDERKLDNGLYYLDISNKSLAASHVDENKLWHYRLGHASDVVLNKLLFL
jgi:GAG-pre-integrase domain